MNERSRNSALLACCALSACALDLAAGSGLAMPRHSTEPAHAVWTGELRGSLQLPGALSTGYWPLDHLVLGVEAQGRGEYGRGSSYTAGGSLGFGALSDSWLSVAQFEGGVPVVGHGPQRYYTGGSVTTLFVLGRESDVSQRNDHFSLVRQRTAIGPMLRYRHAWVRDARQSNSPHTIQDLTVGVQFRLLFSSDFL